MFKKFNQEEIERLDELDTKVPKSGLFCSNCFHFITNKETKIKKEGAHQHTCTNPAHLTFKIGCFKEAPGCTHVGIPTSEHSWFRGYRWCIALCHQCKKHLGWSFLGSSDQFYGLILNEIVEK